jgi:hypothetical protein
MNDMTIDDGRWYGWNGGECPVHPKSVVQVKILEGNARNGGSGIASDYTWKWSGCYPENNIIAFRVTKPYVEPREVWVSFDETGLPYAYLTNRYGATLFREVVG